MRQLNGMGETATKVTWNRIEEQEKGERRRL